VNVKICKHRPSVARPGAPGALELRRYGRALATTGGRAEWTE